MLAPSRPSAFVVPALFVLLAAAAGCGSSPTCDLDSTLRRRAGAGGVDCGHVAIGAPTTATDQCIADQTARGAPFFARYDLQGTDSRVSVGVVRDPGGRSAVMFWDSDPSGGGNAGGRITETFCGGDPPIQTPLTKPDGFPPVTVTCTVEISSDLVCMG